MQNLGDKRRFSRTIFRLDLRRKARLTKTKSRFILRQRPLLLYTLLKMIEKLELLTHQIFASGKRV